VLKALNVGVHSEIRIGLAEANAMFRGTAMTSHSCAFCSSCSSARAQQNLQQVGFGRFDGNQQAQSFLP
jgi:hypothetical protein